MIDEHDKAILRILSKDGKTKYKEIADQLGVTPQTIRDRIDKLQEKKIINKFSIEINPGEIGFPIEFICELDIQSTFMNSILEVLNKIPEVHTVKITTGIHDILCLGHVSGVDNLYEIVEERISVIKGVNKTYTSITLRTIKENQKLNLDNEDVDIFK